MFVFGRKIIERKILYKFSGVLYDEDDLDPKVVAEKEIREFEETLEEEAVRSENNSN